VAYRHQEGAALLKPPGKGDAFANLLNGYSGISKIAWPLKRQESGPWVQGLSPWRVQGGALLFAPVSAA